LSKNTENKHFAAFYIKIASTAAKLQFTPNKPKRIFKKLLSTYKNMHKKAQTIDLQKYSKHSNFAASAINLNSLC